MKTIKFSHILLLATVILFSCNRKDNNQTAGKGGAAVLRIVPKHHGIYTNIINAKMYIKYNAQDLPSSYDDSANCNSLSGQPTAIFNGLKGGNYYLYCQGFDTSIKQNVKGGMPYTIANEVTIDLSLPVTEAH